MTPEAGYRLSPQQRYLWRLLRSFPRRELVEISAEIGADITPEKFRDALGAIVAEQEILRTIFVAAAGLKYPLQMVRSALPPRIEIADSSESEGGITAQYRPETGPALQCRIDPMKRIVRLAASALCADPHAMVALLRAAIRRCRSGQVEVETVQYPDYAGWINDVVEAVESQPGREYWRRILEAGPQRCVPLLSGQRPTSSEQDHCASGVASLPDDQLSGDIFLASVWALLVSEHSDSRDIMIAMDLSGRTQAELVEAVGPLERCLPVRVRIDPDSDFTHILRSVEREMAAAEGWQDCFEHPEDTFTPAASLERSPTSGDLARDGYRVLSTTPTPQRAALHLVYSAGGAQAAFEIVCDGSQYGSADAAEFARQLVDLTRTLAGNPRAKPSKAARPQISRGTVFPRLEHETILQLLERQSLERPSHQAVVCGESVVTYGDLDRVAQSICSVLLAGEMKPGAVVPLLFDRIPEFLGAQWGVMRAGGAYCPIDASYPAARIEWILDKIDPAHVLTHEALRSRLPETRARVISVDALENARGGAVTPTVRAGSLAYVVFTSGSTGNPKGVAVGHEALLRSTLARKEVYGASPERLLLLAGLAFDSSVAGIFWTLAGGGTVYLTPAESTRDPRRIAELIESWGITHIQILPSLYRALLEERASLDSLRAVTVAGEVCPPAVVALHQRRIPRAMLVNEYGPTESTVWSTAHHCLPDAVVPAQIPLGRPAGHVTARIVDRHLDEVAPGIAGEIAIGGPGLARGYWNDPALTAERFRPDPDSPGGVVYLSGDRGFRRPDGTLEFLGRADEQLKIRGVRVEPGEIETVLLEMTEIREACVVPRGDPGSIQLEAFVAAQPGRVLEEGSLRASLRARLPEQMVPARISVLSALPRSPNGKIDRVTLRKTEFRQPPSARAMPATAVQKALAEIWVAVLRLESVGIHDNFFDLGGDSIQILRIRAEAARRGMDFELRRMLECPTIAGLEAAIAAHVPTAAETVPAPFALLTDEQRLATPAGLGDAYPTTALQKRMILQSEAAPGQGLYHDVMTCKLGAGFDERRFRQAVARVTARHPILRTSFGLSRSLPQVQYVHRDVPAAIEVVDLRTMDSSEQQRRIQAFLAAEAGRQFDHERPPLIRYTVHLLNDNTCNLTWTSHHAILDGWSASTLAAELIHEYANPQAEHGNPGPPYSEYVRLERESSADPAAHRFWSEYLRDAPLSRIGHGIHSSAERLVFAKPLTAELAAAFAASASESGVSVRSALAAVHLCVLARFCAAEDFVSAIFSHGRPDVAGSERTLGLFLNFLPLRLRGFPGTWREAFRRVANAEADSFAYRRFSGFLEPANADLPFDTVFNYLDFRTVSESARAAGISVLDTDSLNKNEFAWNTVFRQSDYGLQLEVHIDPVRVPEEQARSGAVAMEAAMARVANGPDRAVAAHLRAGS